MRSGTKWVKGSGMVKERGMGQESRPGAWNRHEPGMGSTLGGCKSLWGHGPGRVQEPRKVQEPGLGRGLGSCKSLGEGRDRSPGGDSSIGAWIWHDTGTR